MEQQLYAIKQILSACDYAGLEVESGEHLITCLGQLYPVKSNLLKEGVSAEEIFPFEDYADGKVNYEDIIERMKIYHNKNK